MARTLEEIRQDALRLPAEDRMQLIQTLHESVMTLEEREVEQAWIEEAERRDHDWRAGRAPGAEREPDEPAAREGAQSKCSPALREGCARSVRG